MAGILIVDQIQNSANTNLISNGVIAANTIGPSQLQTGTALSNIGTGGMDQSYLNASSQYTGFKNRIINGRMEIAQRFSTNSTTVSGTSYAYQMDRFYCGGLSGISAPFTLQQVTDAPAGFGNSVKVTVANTDALSNAATEYGFQHNIEAYNTSDFNPGSSAAATVTLSFWVKSSLTGTFGMGIRNAPTFNRAYVTTYTINSANTWEYKTITFTMDTTGTWNWTGSSASINITWSLGCGSNFNGTAGTWQAGAPVQTSGSVKVVSNAGATWQLTGVQLEKGSTATSFDMRPYAKELMLCQRYYEKSFPTTTAVGHATGFAGCITAEQWATGHNYLRFNVVEFAVEKRGAPSITFYNPVTASFSGSNIAGSEDSTTTLNATIADRTAFRGTRAFFPLLNGSVQSTNNQYQVWCVHWTAESEI